MKTVPLVALEIGAYSQGGVWVPLMVPRPWGGSTYGGWGSREKAIARLIEMGALWNDGRLEMAAFNSNETGLRDLVARYDFLEQPDLFSRSPSRYGVMGE